MDKSELTTMDGNHCILSIRGLPPFTPASTIVKNHPNYKYTAEASKRNAFDLDPPDKQAQETASPMKHTRFTA